MGKNLKVLGNDKKLKPFQHNKISNSKKSFRFEGKTFLKVITFSKKLRNQRQIPRENLFFDLYPKF